MLKYSVLEIKYWVRTVIDSVSMLITGQYSVNDLSGPVGVVDAIGTAYDDVKSQGVLVTVMTMLNMVILLSSNLGVMNPLPLPALDGGRLVFLIIEAIQAENQSGETWRVWFTSRACASDGVDGLRHDPRRPADPVNRKVKSNKASYSAYHKRSARIWGFFMKNLRMQQEMTDRGRLEIRVNARIQARPCFRGAGDGFVYGRSAECDRGADYRRGRQNGDAGSGDAAARVQSGTECESAVFRIYGESGGGRV